jgi:hypothetical protein
MQDKQMEELTGLVNRITHHALLVEEDPDLTHKGERLLGAQLLKLVILHVKQLQLEVLALEQRCDKRHHREEPT